jgi:hypothetical protein
MNLMSVRVVGSEGTIWGELASLLTAEEMRGKFHFPVLFRTNPEAFRGIGQDGTNRLTYLISAMHDLDTCLLGWFDPGERVRNATGALRYAARAIAKELDSEAARQKTA